METKQQQLAVWGMHMGRPGGDIQRRHLDLAEDLQQQGYVAIGWPDIGDLSTLPNDRGSFREQFVRSYGQSVSASASAAAAGMLYRFVHILHLGDIIVSPSPLGRIVRVGHVSGEYQYLPGLLEEYPNLRAVEWRVEVPLQDLGQQARLSLRAQRSLFRILAGEAEFRALAMSRTT